MFGLFRKSEPEPILLTWSKKYTKEFEQIQDKDAAFGQKLIFYGASVFIQKEIKNLNLGAIKSDATIIELSLYFLFLVDYLLHVKKVDKRDLLMSKFINEFESVFSKYLVEIDSAKIINSRLNLFGEQTRLGRGSVVSGCMKLTQDLINSSNQLKGFQYYESRKGLILEFDPGYGFTIEQLTSNYLKLVSNILEKEIELVAQGIW